MLLDTTVLIDLLRQNNDSIKKISGLEKNNEPLSITSVTLFEVLQGLKKIVSTQREQKILQILKRFTIIPFDEESAYEAGYIAQGLFAKGLIIESEDIMIAGIAKAKNETVLTRNIKHFSRVEGLQVQTY